MRRVMKFTGAILAAMAMPLIAVAPASATPPDLSTMTFDCEGFSPRPYPVDIPLYEASVTMTFENCPGSYILVDQSNTTNASTVISDVDASGTVSIGTMTIVGNVEVVILIDEFSQLALLSFRQPFEMPDPSGTQLFDSNQDLRSDAPEATWGTPSEIDNGDEINIGGMNECGIEPGDHVYATQSFTVSTAGVYTFRVTGVDPLSGYFQKDVYPGSELDDPMVALYSTFNTLDPASDIVGCNDDLNDLTFGGRDYGENAFNLTQQGDYVEGHFSYFTSSLEPGDYMMVFTTWGLNSSSDWSANTPGGGTINFDVWGPAGGMTLTDVDPKSEKPSNNGGSRSVSTPALAFTGVDPSAGLWTASLLFGTGAVIVIARRRRAKSRK